MLCLQRDAAALGLRTGFAWLTGLAESGSERSCEFKISANSPSESFLMRAGFCEPGRIARLEAE